MVVSILIETNWILRRQVGREAYNSGVRIGTI